MLLQLSGSVDAIRYEVPFQANEVEMVPCNVVSDHVMADLTSRAEDQLVELLNKEVWASDIHSHILQECI